jgi:hypothetical protein
VWRAEPRNNNNAPTGFSVRALLVGYDQTIGQRRVDNVSFSIRFRVCPKRRERLRTEGQPLQGAARNQDRELFAVLEAAVTTLELPAVAPRTPADAHPPHLERTPHAVFVAGRATDLAHGP